MLLMGDEVRRTQRGNNNAYCQDNEISWFEWTGLHRHRDLHRFVKTLVRQRQMLGTLLPVQGKTLNEILRDAEIQLHGVRLNEPDLSADSHSLALTVQAPEAPVMFHAMFNCYWQPLVFDLPRLEPRRVSWRRWIDTDRDAPDDVCDAPLAPPVDTRATRRARSVVVLFALRVETDESRRGARELQWSVNESTSDYQ